MALTTTSLNGAITASQTFVKATSATPTTGTAAIANGDMFQIDGERMRVTDVSTTPTFQVVRGYDGTLAVAHATLAPFIFGRPFDWNSNAGAPVTPRALVSIGANGVIAVPTVNTLLTIDKATALATTTLAAPTSDSNGVVLTITSNTAAAHVITATSLIADAVSGSPHTTLTFAAFKGASIVLTIQNGLYNVTSAVGVTVS